MPLEKPVSQSMRPRTTRSREPGGFSDCQAKGRLTADGRMGFTEIGSLDAQLFCPQTQSPVGPIVHLYAYRGAPGVPDRVGVAFFHLLKGCKVLWDLDKRLWDIEYP